MEFVYKLSIFYLKLRILIDKYYFQYYKIFQIRLSKVKMFRQSENIINDSFHRRSYAVSGFLS